MPPPFAPQFALRLVVQTISCRRQWSPAQAYRQRLASGRARPLRSAAEQPTLLGLVWARSPGEATRICGGLRPVAEGEDPEKAPSDMRIGIGSPIWSVFAHTIAQEAYRMFTGCGA